MKETRNTVQKDIIYQTVVKMKNHPTADMVLEEVHKIHSHISKGTVYRILNFLSEKEAIVHIRMPHGADCFDTRMDNHYHIRCVHCKKVQDVEVTADIELEPIKSSIIGFKITGHHIVFDGICVDCVTD